MTDLTRNFKRLTAAKVNGVALVATLGPYDVTLTVFGTSAGYRVPWAAIYELGAKMKAREHEMEQRQTRRMLKGKR